MQSILQFRRFGSHVERQLEANTSGIHKANRAHAVQSPPSKEIVPSRDLPDRFESGANVEKQNVHALQAPGINANAERGKETLSGYDQGEEEELEEDKEEYEGEIANSSFSRKEEEESDIAEVRNADEQNQGTLQNVLSRISTVKSTHSLGTKIGLSLTGINVRDRTTKEGGNRDRQVFVVGFQGAEDPLSPHNWSKWTRYYATFQVASVGFVVGVASSIDSSAVSQAAREFGVSEVVESLATGLFLAGFGCGALVAGPMSETFGRNPVYIGTLALYMIFIMASGLAPNIGAQLTFRFIAGVFGATPLATAGGSVADMWNSLERVYMFPVFANAAFMGPILGPVMGGYIASSSLISWRWTEWITLIMSGLVLLNLVFFQPETYPGLLLKWKAAHLRRITGDSRFVAPMEIREETFVHRIVHALYRPFIMVAREPIILLVALYLTIIYIILFGFLDGFTYIFSEVHGTSQGVTGLCFLGIAAGLCVSSALVPLIYKWAKEENRKLEEQGGGNLAPEFRLWFAMLGGSIALPISMFWMAWTSYPSISIWSPLIASVFFGYGILSVFISSYQYIIDSYESFAASALAAVTLIRYIAAGGAVVWGIPFYENLGVHWACTILGLIALLMAPVPYVFYFYGARLRLRSKYAAGSKSRGS